MSRRRVEPAVCAALLFLPGLTHVALTGGVSQWRASSELGLLDVAISGVLVTHFAASAWVLRRGKYAGRLALATWSVLLTLAGTELYLRFARPTEAAVAIAPLPPGTRICTAADTMPGISGEIRLSVNRLGLRGPDIGPRDLPRFDVKILCVGGSTTMCQYNTDERSWPWRLQDELAERLGQRVFVGNSGRSGLIARNHGDLIARYDLTHEFDWVIVMCGLNDWGMFLQGEYDASRERSLEALDGRSKFSRDAPYYHRRLRLVQWIDAATTPTGRKLPFGNVVVTDDDGTWFADWRQERKKLLARRTFDELPPRFEEFEAKYREDLLGVIAAARSKGVRLLMVSQPTIYRADLPEAMADLLISTSPPHGAYSHAALEQVSRRANEVMLDVCRREGVDHIDLDRILPKDTSVYFDDCHFNDAGCERIGVVLANFFEPRLR
ncbi:MAG: SGNH/GDSL hydrolase family protein [Planctomycetaceae bacterium]